MLLMLTIWGGGAKLRKIREWWDRVVENGPKYGYFPKAEKSWLVVKAEVEQEAIEIFKDTGVNITIEGRKYLGGLLVLRKEKKTMSANSWKSGYLN